MCTDTQLPRFGGAGICDQLRVRPNGEVAVTCDTSGELLDASGAPAMNFANPNEPLDNNLRFAALDADGKSFWMGTLAGLLARYDIATGQRVDRWTAGPGLGGIARLQPAPAARSAAEHLARHDDHAEHVGRQPGRRHAPSGGLLFSSAPSLDMPAFEVSHGRLLTSGARCGSTRACR